MTSPLFALLIGIDKYRHRKIRRLRGSVRDAWDVKQFLVDDLFVHEDNICLLENEKATQSNIEAAFISHLLNNKLIQRGDAILIYFAGHGSSISSPVHWNNTEELEDVPVLCPYDYDSKFDDGSTIAGISDRSLFAMMEDLCQEKGNNITVILDTSFTGSSSSYHASRIRSTDTRNATDQDLCDALWKSALNRSRSSVVGAGLHLGNDTLTHVTICACRPEDELAQENGRKGGLFTQELLRVLRRAYLHDTSYKQLADQLDLGAHQHPTVTGINANRPLFCGRPFGVDRRFSQAVSGPSANSVWRVGLGSVHGIVEGAEFSVYEHNRIGSRNEPIGLTLRASRVHPTWCLAWPQQSRASVLFSAAVVSTYWVLLLRWNNRVQPLKVWFASPTFLRCWTQWRIARQFPAAGHRSNERGRWNGAVQIVRVSKLNEADLVVRVTRRALVLLRMDHRMLSDPERRSLHQITQSMATSRPLDVFDDAARFHLHLGRENPRRPLAERVGIGLYSLDSTTWNVTGQDLVMHERAQLAYDRARLPYDEQALYAVVVRNNTDRDLWPYLFYMDPGTCSISRIHTGRRQNSESPLPAGSELLVGTGEPDSEALRFAMDENDARSYATAFIKVFFCTRPVQMDSLEQGIAEAAEAANVADADDLPSTKGLEVDEKQCWDSSVVCVTVERRPLSTIAWV